MNKTDYLALPRPNGRLRRLYDHERIKTLGLEGYTDRQIAEEVGCSYSLVWKILNDIAGMYGDYGSKSEQEIMAARVHWQGRLETAQTKLRQIEWELRRRARLAKRRAT